MSQKIFCVKNIYLLYHKNLNDLFLYIIYIYGTLIL